MRRALAGVLAVLAGGCVIIVEPDGGPTPAPVPAPLTCVTAPDQPSAHVYFSARIERSTVNLVDAYRGFMERTVLALAGAGIQTRQAVLVRADERPGGQPLLAAWGCRLDSPERLPPEHVLTWYATQEALASPATGCATDAIVHLGAHLNEVVTQYPRALRGTNGLSVFGSAPDLVLVVHLDPLARRAGYDAPECGSARRLPAVDERGRAAWLAAYAGDDLPPDRVVHWLVRTEEGVDRPTFVDACRGHEGFPSHVLDLIEPSPVALYDPLRAGLVETGAGAASLSFCAMLSDDRAFLARQASEIAGRLGLTVPEEQIQDVLDNGLPSPEDIGEGGPLDRPGGP